MYNYAKLEENEIEWVAVAAAEDLPNGERLFVQIDQDSLVVFNIAEQYFAIADVCSHDDGPVGEGRVEGMEVICPRHGARFDIRSGKATALPAYQDIPAYPVRVTDGQIEVGLPAQI